MVGHSKILIVEDEVIVALAIESQLIELGYEIAGIFTSGEEALKKVKELRPDLILMDLKLAGLMDGIEAAKAICSSGDVPIIFLTGYLKRSMREQVKLFGLGGLIVKPFKSEDLVSAIELALKNNIQANKPLF